MKTHARYVALDTNLQMVILDPIQNPDAWRAYVNALAAVYGRRNVPVELAGTEQLVGTGCALFGLALNENDEIAGGVRVEGPFTDPEQIPGVRAMRCSEDGYSRDYVRLVDHLTPLCSAGGLVEAKGIFKTDKAGNVKVGTSLTRLANHCSRLLHASHIFGVAAKHRLHDYSNCGYNVLPGFPSASHHGFESYPLLQNPGYELELTPRQRMIELFERRCVGMVEEATASTDLRAEILLDGDHRLTELRSDGVVLSDLHEHQRSELRRLLPPVDDFLLKEPPRWVYFPWRRCAMRILGPHGYRRLRTDRNRNKMTQTELNDMWEKTVGVVGLSVGQASAVILAQGGLCGRLKIADFDELELHNMNRVAASVVELGQKKAHITARRLAEMDPYQLVEIFDAGVQNDNVNSFMRGLDLVVEEADSLDIKLLVREKARDQRVPVIMETSDRGLLDVERFDLEPDRALFHGILGQVSREKLAGLSTKDKIPYVIRLSEPMSPEALSSLGEFGKTLAGWPQLARDISLGSALVATATHTLFTGRNLPSGRMRIDLREQISRLEDPLKAAAADTKVLNPCRFSANPKL